MAHRRSALITAVALVVALVVALGGCGGKSTPHPPPDRRVVNLHALARLYGVVRFFHPGDTAASVDWDRFVVHGVREVEGARDRGELEAALRALFAPIAPAVWIGSGATPADPEPPASLDGLELVAWQHHGYGFDPGNVYVSKRHGRSTERVDDGGGGGFVARAQSLSAVPYRGKQLRLRAQIRSDAASGGGQLWMRADLPGGNVGFFDNMGGRAIQGDAWAPGEIIGTIDATADSVVLGVMLIGPGTAWFDQVEVSVRAADGTWTPVTVTDGGFESADALTAWHGQDQPGYQVSIDTTGAAAGKASLKVAASAAQVTTIVDDPFPELPAAGEIAEVDLGDGLRARVPLTLYSRDGHTLGDPAENAAALTATVAAIDLTAGDADPAIRIADVIVAWNVFQHFYPYFDVVPVDWLAALDVQLADALDDAGALDTVATLQRLVAAVEDGHGNVWCEADEKVASPPVRLEWIEDQAVVIASGDDRLAVGDVVTAIDGRPSADVLAEQEALRSGSPQWRRYLASIYTLLGKDGSEVRLAVAGKDDVVVTRTAGAMPQPSQGEAIRALDGGVWYVDLGRASTGEILAVMDQLVAAPGVIFDLRGYPNSNHEILSHLLTRPDTSTAWMQIPRFIYPDHERIAGWDRLGWELPVATPHIGGKVAFLTGAGAISYAESVMGLVEHYRLGAIVGEATAGTNGNVVKVSLPGGCTFTWTGMRVVKHDGSRQHLLGIEPTVPATRTVAGVRAGRDEVLEAALEVVRAR